MKNDVADYMRYYTIDRLHSANDDWSPMKFELSDLNVSTTTWPEHITLELIALIAKQENTDVQMDMNTNLSIAER